MTDTTTNNHNSNITVDVIPLTEGFNQAFNMKSFLAFHNYAVEKSAGSLKPLTADDIQQANYAVIATDNNGKKKGQCLLFNAVSDIDRVTPYSAYLSTPENSIVLTSLSGRKAFIPILEEIQSSSMLAGVAICAKTKAENVEAKEIFEKTGFNSEGPTTVAGDEYESYLYHGKNTYEENKTVIASPHTSDVEYNGLTPLSI